MDKYSVGDEVYYIGLFNRLKKAKIIQIGEERGLEQDGLSVRSYSIDRYLIEFENGKKKIVYKRQLF